MNVAATAVEYTGLAAIVVGVALVFMPAGIVLFGVMLTLYAQGYAAPQQRPPSRRRWHVNLTGWWRR